VLDRLLAARHLDDAIVFACSEFALHEDVCAFGQSWSALREPLRVTNDIVPLRFVFHSPLSSFQERVVATENLVTGAPFDSCLVSAFLPMYPMIVS
jgi:hypothetical protein